jgi:hypothetical protein
MAEGRIYIASTVSVILVNAQGLAIPLGLVDNLRMEKDFVVEGVPEIGNFFFADILTHGASARFSWGQSYSAGSDLVAKGLVPADQTIAQFGPMFLRLVDQLGQREIGLIYRGVLETFSIDTNARARLMHNVSGIAISLLLESELN